MINRILTIAHIIWLEMIRKKSFYVLLILIGALMFYLMSLNAFGLNSAVRYLKDVGLLLVWIFSWVLTITLAARQLPAEEQRGTVYPLLAKPVSRSELVLGKWAGSWSASSLATLVFYVAVYLIVFLRGGTFELATSLQALMLHIMLLGIVAAIAVLLSTRQHFDAAATLTFVICLASFAIIPRIPTMLVQATGITSNILLGLYYAMPHFELFDMRRRLVHGWGPAPWTSVLAVMSYGLMWSTILLLLACAAYRKKKFKRENIG